MIEILSLLSRGKQRSQEIPSTIQYRKAGFTESRAYYHSICDAAASRRTASEWLVSVVGAPDQKAIEILGAIGRTWPKKSLVKLRWWDEAPPSYDPKSGSSAKWVGYDPEHGCCDAPQEDSGAEVIVLYYSNGCDPFALLQNIPGGEYMAYYTRRMLVPICDYVIDKESCKTVVCSEYCPLHEIKSGGSRYYAPISCKTLCSCIEALFQLGGEAHTLGEMNASFKDFSKTRRARLTE